MARRGWFGRRRGARCAVVRFAALSFLFLLVSSCEADACEMGLWRAGDLDAGAAPSARRSGSRAYLSVYPSTRRSSRGRAATGTRFPKGRRGHAVAMRGIDAARVRVLRGRRASAYVSFRFRSAAAVWLGRTHSFVSSSKTNLWRLPVPDAIHALFRARTIPPVLMN